LKKLEKVILIPLMLLTSLFIVPAVPYAHAAGQVCLADPATTGCPALPPTFDAAPGSILNVAVRASGVDALNGFDIQVVSDPTILTGVSADLTGSVIPFSALVICINGVLKTGSSCAPTDADGVVHLAAVNTAGLTTVAPTNGLLFTAVFKVLAGSTGTPISFNTGCSGTSVSGVCLTIANGVPGSGPIPVSIQEATFVHGPDYGLSVTPSTTTVAPGFNANYVLTLTSQGGFTDTIGLAAVSAMGATPPSFDCNSGNPIGGINFPPLNVSVSVSSLVVPSGGSATATITAGVAPQPFVGCDVNGNNLNLFPAYVITVTGTSSAAVSHSANVVAQDTAQDFSISASPMNGLVVPIGGSRTSTLTLTSIAAFADTVSFSSVTNINGPTTAVSPASVTLTAFGTATATLTITVPSTADFAAYDTTVTATSSAATGVTHTVDVTYVISGTDFNLAAVPDHIVTLATLSGSSNIKISSPGTFAGPLTYSATVIPTGTNTPANCSPCSTILGTSFAPATGSVTAGGLTITDLTIATTANSALGNYTIVVSVTSGSITHRVFVTLALGDFGLSLSNTALTAIPGTLPSTKNAACLLNTSCSVLTVTALGGFGNTNYIVGQNGISFLGATNPQVTKVPQLPGAPKLRLVQVYFTNGTLVPQTIVFIKGVRTCSDCGVFGPIAWVPSRQVFPDATIGLVAKTRVNVQVTAATPAGDYIVSITGIGGPILHTITANVHVPEKPQFTQFVPFHKLSLSGSQGTLTTKGGVINVDTQTTLYIRIQVSGVDSTGTKTFTATSAVIQLLPGQTVNNIPYTALFGPQTLGTTYTYTGSISYGLSATSLTATSSGGTAIGNTGTLFVVA
jgi:hypothetical protein